MTPHTSHLHDSTPHSRRVSVWPRPGKEPLVDVDRAVFIAVHRQAAVLAAIRAYPQRHVFFVLTDMARLRRVVLIFSKQFFPKAPTLVLKHLHKAIEPPIIIHHAVADLPLAPLCAGFLLLLPDDHLPLGKIADHHSPFSQSVCDEMGGFMQTVALFIALAFGHPLVDPREVEVAARLLLAAVSLGANFVQLLVVPAVAAEAADVVEASLVVDARRQRLDAQIESDDALLAQGASLAFSWRLVPTLRRIVVDERAVIVPPRISGHGYLVKVVGWIFRKVRLDVLVAFRPPLAASAGRENDRLTLHVQVHRGITQSEELMARLAAWKSRFLTFRQATEERLHGPI